MSFCAPFRAHAKCPARIVGKRGSAGMCCGLLRRFPKLGECHFGTSLGLPLRVSLLPFFVGWFFGCPNAWPFMFFCWGAVPGREGTTGAVSSSGQIACFFLPHHHASAGFTRHAGLWARLQGQGRSSTDALLQMNNF